MKCFVDLPCSSQSPPSRLLFSLSEPYWTTERPLFIKAPIHSLPPRPRVTIEHPSFHTRIGAACTPPSPCPQRASPPMTLRWGKVLNMGKAYSWHHPDNTYTHCECQQRPSVFEQLFVGLTAVLKILKIFFGQVDTSKSLNFRHFSVKSVPQQAQSSTNNGIPLILKCPKLFLYYGL